jgi:hypothetical protein
VTTSVISVSALAQDSTISSRACSATVVTVSDDSVDRWRTDQILGSAQTSGFLLRSAARTMTSALANRRLCAILPRIEFVNNSLLPSGENDGALWSGKGGNIRIIGGVEGAIGGVRFVIAPEYVSSENKAFEPTPLYNPGLPPSRNPLSSPWNVYPYSIDAPVRFGTSRYTRLAPGQSTAYALLGPVELGLASDNEWWGPGIRSAILMSDNAEGIPRAFLRTAHPLRTRAGNVEATWMVGGLVESRWFDFDSTNDVRSISAFAITWSPAVEPDLTLGFGRTVFAPSSGWRDVPGRLFDAFTSTGRPDARGLADSSFRPGKDQIFSFFGRWVFPSNGFETYAEWARAEMPRSFRDFLLAPNNTQGYTFGLQWARPAGAGKVRLQAEHTYLEQSPTFRDRPIGSFYTSRAVIQGYTNRGQVIGAGIGQGSSGELFAVDYVAAHWELGVVGTRTRFNDDAYYLLPWPPGQGYCQHDVTIAPGIRGGVMTPLGRFSMQYATDYRMNAYFQNLTACSGAGPKLDIKNRTLRLVFTAGR